MEVIKLCEGEDNQGKDNDPGLPMIELVDSVNDCTNNEFDCRFRNQ